MEAGSFLDIIQLQMKKESFQNWYKSQSWYRTREDREKDALLEDATITIPLPWKSDEEALKDFWDYCEERQREERIIAEMKIKG